MIFEQELEMDEMAQYHTHAEFFWNVKIKNALLFDRRLRVSITMFTVLMTYTVVCDVAINTF